MIERLSRGALLKILSGDVLSDGTCVIKFYSNNCHLCHALKETYEEVSSDYNDLYFFAFNIKDDPKISKVLKFKGVPNISMLKIRKGKRPEVKNIAEPKSPNEATWYTAEEIRSFIEKEKQ
jgi:thiol-disulfide isomerase/thioredoxin